MNQKDIKALCEKTVKNSEWAVNAKKYCKDDKSSKLVTIPPPVVASSEPVKVVELVGSSGFCPNGNPLMNYAVMSSWLLIQ